MLPPRGRLVFVCPSITSHEEETNAMLPLDDVRILDLSRLAPGPFCTMLLGDLGADVLLIEPPPDSRAGQIPGGGDPYNALGRNKRSIILNLRDDESREVFMRLAESAEVVLEGFRPGVGKRLGGDDGAGADTDDTEPDATAPAGSGGVVDLIGDADRGVTVYAANFCGSCHCDDASGGCLPTAPDLRGSDLTTLLEKLQGGAPHVGGAFPDLTAQDIADLETFLAQ